MIQRISFVLILLSSVQLFAMEASEIILARSLDNKSIVDLISELITSEEKPKHTTFVDYLYLLDNKRREVTNLMNSSEVETQALQLKSDLDILNQSHKSLCIYWARMILNTEQIDKNEVEECIGELTNIAIAANVPLQHEFTKKREKKAAITVTEKLIAAQKVLVDDITAKEKSWQKDLVARNTSSPRVENNNEVHERKVGFFKSIKTSLDSCEEIDRDKIVGDKKNGSQPGATHLARDYERLTQTLEKELFGPRLYRARQEGDGHDGVDAEYEQLLNIRAFNSSAVQRAMIQSKATELEIAANREAHLALLEQDIEDIDACHSTYKLVWEEVIIVRAQLKKLLPKKYKQFSRVELNLLEQATKKTQDVKGKGKEEEEE